jgi:hypothetical protein
LVVPADFFLVDERLPILAAPTGIPIYDFDFRAFLACRHPFGAASVSNVVARIGAFDDYEAQYRALREEGIVLVHDPEQHAVASTLGGWYPRLADLTPRTICFDTPPSAREVEDAFGWPVFLKGARQTNRHRRATSIVRSKAEFDAAMGLWKDDPVLGWQAVACREYQSLRPVDDPDPERIPSSFEFRFFFWRGELAAAGRYWWQGVDYRWTDAERRQATAIASEAARRVDVPFLVVDVAQTTAGAWIVIECNDGQESGYAGVSPFALWQEIVAIERRRTSS